MANTYRKRDPREIVWARENPEYAEKKDLREYRHDGKDWGKPASWYKKMQRRLRRSRERHALRNGEEIPFFRKTDVWDAN